MPSVDLFHLAQGMADGISYTFTMTQTIVLAILVIGLAVFWGAIIIGNILDRNGGH